MYLKLKSPDGAMESQRNIYGYSDGRCIILWAVSSHDWKTYHSNSLVFLAHLKDDSILHIWHIWCNKGGMHNNVHFITKVLTLASYKLRKKNIISSYCSTKLCVRKLNNTFSQILVRHIILKFASIVTSLTLLGFHFPRKKLPP